MATVAVVSFPREAVAQTVTVWNSTTSSTWNNSSNWTNGIPNSTSTIYLAQFGVVSNTSASPANTTGIPGTSWNVGGIEITSARVNSMTIGASGTTGSTLTTTLLGTTINGVADSILRNGSSQLLAFQQTNPSASNLLSLALGDATNNKIAIDGTGNIAVGIVIKDGTGTKLALNGSGTGALILSAANTFSGGFTLSSGTVAVGSNSISSTTVTSGAFGTGTLTLNGGTLRSTAATTTGDRTISNNLSLGGSITLGDATNTGALNFNNTGLTNASTALTANTTLTTNSAVSIANAISGDFSLTKSGASTLFLTNGSNAYTGGTTINGGTVAINGPNRLGSANGALTINAGTFQLTTINGVNTGISSGRNIILGDVSSTMQIDTGPGYTATGAALVSGTGTLNKTGAGALVLAGANTYSGGTNVTAGTLLVTNTTGSGTGTGAVNVNAGLFGGNGISTGAVTVANGATFLPSAATAGNTVGKLTVGDGGSTTGLTLNGTLQINLNVTAVPAAGTNYSQASVVGALTLSTVNTGTSALTLNATANSALAVGQVLFIVLNDGTDAVVGTFNGQAEGSTVTDNLGDTYTLSYLGNGDAGTLGNDVSLTVSGVTPVPEPATLFGGVLLVGALAWNQRRRLAGLTDRRVTCAV